MKILSLECTHQVSLHWSLHRAALTSGIATAPGLHLPTALPMKLQFHKDTREILKSIQVGPLSSVYAV